MIKKLLLASFVAGCCIASANESFAQGPNFGPSYDRPAVSPYLNLLDLGYAVSGISPYQTLVQPLVQQREATEQQQNQIQQLQRAQRASSSYGGVRGTAGSSVRATGHTTRFQNYSHYYAQRSINPR